MEPISIQLVNDKDFLDHLQSLLVPLIALITTFIAYRQWKIEQNKLTHDLFEKRFQIYKHFNVYMAEIHQSGTCSMEQYHKFVAETSASLFLFGDDINSLKKDLQEKGMELWTINKELQSDKWTKEEKAKKINRKLELQKWFLHTNTNHVFSKYMNITS
jgi:hypothetical protein